MLHTENASALLTNLSAVLIIGDLSSIEIDQFSFAPGPHVLLISFNLTSGESGTFEYDFVGEIRERKCLTVGAYNSAW